MVLRNIFGESRIWWPCAWLLGTILCLMTEHTRAQENWGSFSPPPVAARSAVLMNATTGEILFAKEPHLRLPPASTTKVLTALLAMERLNPDSQVFVSPQAASAPPSRVGLRAGNAASAQDLLYGLLLKSGNDAAETLAEAAGGSIYGFASLMNAKAWQIGAHDSHFMNPHGLPDEDHYSTAYDLAIIFRYAMNYPMFADIVRTRSATLRIESGQGPYGDSRLVPVLNHNRLLASYEGARGGKTGFTLKARRCFVGEVDRGGTRLIVSILNSPNSGTLWQDARTLLDYGFTHYGLAPPPPMQPEVEPQPILVRRSPVVTPDRVRMAQVSPEAEEEAPESAMDSSSPPATTPEPSRAIIVRRTPVSPPNPERTVVMARSAVEDDEPEPVETRRVPTTPVFDTPAVRQPAIAEKKLPTRVKAKTVAESPKAGNRGKAAISAKPALATAKPVKPTATRGRTDTAHTPSTTKIASADPKARPTSKTGSSKEAKANKPGKPATTAAGKPEKQPASRIARADSSAAKLPPPKSTKRRI